MKIPKPASLEETDELIARHRIIGHPTNSDNAAHVILRNTLSPNGFTYKSYYETKPDSDYSISYEQLLTNHNAAMVDGLI